MKWGANLNNNINVNDIGWMTWDNLVAYVLMTYYIKGPNDTINPSGINWGDIGLKFVLYLSDVGWMTKALHHRPRSQW